MSHTITGTAGNDALNGAKNFDDTIYGLAGNDKIKGKSGDDLLYGGSDDDTLP